MDDYSSYYSCNYCIASNYIIVLHGTRKITGCNFVLEEPRLDPSEQTKKTHGFSTNALVFVF